MPSYCKNFEILKLIPSDQNFDDILYYLAVFQSQLLEEFLKRFRNRITNLSPPTFHLALSEYESHFLRTCKILGFRPEDFISDIYDHGIGNARAFNDPLLAEFCLKKYPQYCTVKKRDLIYAFNEDDIDLALLMIKAGGNPYEIDD